MSLTGHTPRADDDPSMEWVDIAVTDGGVFIIDCDTGFSEFREGCFWEDNFQEEEPILPKGAYRWHGFKVCFWDADDAMNVTGGEFLPYVLGDQQTKRVMVEALVCIRRMVPAAIDETVPLGECFDAIEDLARAAIAKADG